MPVTRDQRISVNLSAAERRQLTTEAEQARIPLSRLMRERALATHLPPGGEVVSFGEYLGVSGVSGLDQIEVDVARMPQVSTVADFKAMSSELRGFMRTHADERDVGKQFRDAVDRYGADLSAVWAADIQRIIGEAPERLAGKNVEEIRAILHSELSRLTERMNDVDPPEYEG